MRGASSGVGNDWDSNSCSGPSSGSVALAVVPFVVLLFGCVCVCCSFFCPSCCSSSSPVPYVLHSAVVLAVLPSCIPIPSSVLQLVLSCALLSVLSPLFFHLISAVLPLVRPYRTASVYTPLLHRLPGFLTAPATAAVALFGL